MIYIKITITSLIAGSVSQQYLCGVHRCGRGMLLDHHASNSLACVWKSFTLSELSSIVACCALGSSIVVSDGAAVTVHAVKVVKASNGVCIKEVSIDTRSIDLRGIIRMDVDSSDINTDDSTLVSRAIDGRKYSHTYNELMKLSSSKKATSDNTAESAESSSIEAIIEGMEKCSKVLRRMDVTNAELRLYINQLNIAKTLLHQSNGCNSDRNLCESCFSISYDVNLSTNDKYMFEVKVEVSPCFNGIEFSGKWWVVVLSFPTIGGESRHISAQLSNVTNICVISSHFNVDNIKTLLCNHYPNDCVFELHIMLQDYWQTDPLCYIPIGKKIIQISYFLRPERAIVASVNSFKSFTEFLAEKKSASPLIHEPQSISLSFPISISLLTLIVKITGMNLQPSNSIDELLKVFPINRQLWLHNDNINFKATVAGNTTNIIITGCCIPLLLAIKKDIEDSAKRKPTKHEVTFTPKTIEHIHMSKRLLDTLVGAKHYSLRVLYESVCKIINELPL